MQTHVGMHARVHARDIRGKCGLRSPVFLQGEGGRIPAGSSRPSWPAWVSEWKSRWRVVAKMRQSAMPAGHRKLKLWKNSDSGVFPESLFSFEFRS